MKEGLDGQDDARRDIRTRCQDRQLRALWGVAGIAGSIPSSMMDVLMHAALSQHANVAKGGEPDPDQLSEAVLKKALEVGKTDVTRSS